MKFKIYAIGKCKDKAINSLIEDYLKRFSSKRLEIYEIKQSSSTEESYALFEKSTGTYRILLDEKGYQYSSTKLASHLCNVVRDAGGMPISFLIGGADGHSDELKAKVFDKLSLSKLTMPHMLARLFLVEQLYRANSIVKGHPYHRV